ncbi:MAG: twitching motility protein PilT [Acidimicrobiia bacterium]
MAGLTLDSGALIAADRNDPRLWLMIRAAADDGTPVTVPTVAIVQAWRGGTRSANLARLLAGCAVDALDARQARVGGELLGRTRTSDAVDAAVVVSAASRGDAILTTDPVDLRVLAASMPGTGPIIDLSAIR